MNAKIYLGQIGRLEKMVHNKQIEAQRLRELCGNITVQTDKERIRTSNISDPTARCATELAYISNQIDRWLKKRQYIVNQIDMIEDIDVYELLSYRYVQQLSVVEISDKLNITEKAVWKRLKKAHTVFEDTYGREDS